MAGEASRLTGAGAAADGASGADERTLDTIELE